MVDRVGPPLTMWRTLDGPLGSPTGRHVISVAEADEQRAAHAVGHPDRSVGGFEKRGRQELVAPE